MHFPSNGNDPGPRAESTIPPPSVSNNNPDVSRFMKWAQNAIDSQKIDIDRVSSTLTNIEGEMGLFRSFMDEVRHERKESQQFRANYDQEKRAIGKLAVDLKTLGSKVDNLGREEVARGKSGESLRRDIEIIVSDMRKIHEEATQVGEVKLALGRVARQVIALERTAEQTITNTGTGEANKARDAVLEDYQRNKVVEDLKSQIQGFQNRLNMVEQAVRAVANQPPYVQPAQRTSSIHAQAKALPAQRTTPRVEIPVMKPNESTQRTRSSTRSSVFRQAVQNNVPGDQSDSSLKRKHVHLNEDERLVQNDDDQPAPPRKRGQPPHNAATTEKPGPALVESQQRLLSPTPDRLLSPTPDPEPAEIIEISSAYSPTPPPNQEEQISPKQNTEGNRNQPIEMPVLSKSQVPRQDQVQIETISVYSNTTRNGIGARKVPLRGGSPPNYNHLHPTVNGEPIKNGPSNNRPRRMSLRKTSSSSQLATSVRESEGTPRMDEHCRLRAANGILLTRSGQVDGRSLRHKDVAKNDTPLQQPKLPGGPSMTKGRASMPGNSVVPSVQPEEAFLANRIRNTRTFSSGMLPFGETRSADAEKHKCPVCSATYAYAGGLSYVSDFLPSLHDIFPFPFLSNVIFSINEILLVTKMASRIQKEREKQCWQLGKSWSRRHWTEKLPGGENTKEPEGICF